MSTTPDDANDYPPPQGATSPVPPPPSATGGYPPPAGAGGYPPPAAAGAYPPPASGGFPPASGFPGGYPPPAGTPGGYPPPGYGDRGPTPGGYPHAVAPGAPLSPADQRLWAVLAHLGTLLLWFIAPLVVWLVFRGRGAFLEDHAKESLNFQITIAIAAAALGVLSVLTLGLGTLLYFPFGVVVLIFLIIAAVKASQGEPYRYPLTLRLVR